MTHKTIAWIWFVFMNLAFAAIFGSDFFMNAARGFLIIEFGLISCMAIGELLS